MDRKGRALILAQQVCLEGVPEIIEEIKSLRGYQPKIEWEKSAREGMIDIHYIRDGVGYTWIDDPRNIHLQVYYSDDLSLKFPPGANYMLAVGSVRISITDETSSVSFNQLKHRILDRPAIID
jgi:hypothetical protein